MKVIWFIVNDWEVYFPWEYRWIAKVYIEQNYKPNEISDKVIIKEWSGREVLDAQANLKLMKEHFNITSPTP